MVLVATSPVTLSPDTPLTVISIDVHRIHEWEKVEGRTEDCRLATDD